MMAPRIMASSAETLEAGESSSESPGAQAEPKKELPSGELVYTARTGGKAAATAFRLLFALPWRRFKKGSVLVIELGGDISEEKQGRFSSPNSLPQICGALEKAAHDPRICGVYLKLSPLAAGWGKVQEVRRYLQFFRESGKFTMAYMSQGGEKEYYLASAADEIYVAPTAQFSLRGFKVAGTFLRGVLDKVGVQPELVRIGKYKSAGDQLLRTDMSEPQR